MQQSIISKLTSLLAPELLEVLNESHMHSVPENSETHFKVIAVSAAFDGLSLVKRHQLIYQQLQSELQNGLHALALHTYTLQEWQARQQQVTPSPDCMGGSKSG